MSPVTERAPAATSTFVSLPRVLAALTLAVVLLVVGVWIVWAATRPPTVPISEAPSVGVDVSRAPMP